MHSVTYIQRIYFEFKAGNELITIVMSHEK